MHRFPWSAMLENTSTTGITLDNPRARGASSSWVIHSIDSNGSRFHKWNSKLCLHGRKGEYANVISVGAVEPDLLCFWLLAGVLVVPATIAYVANNLTSFFSVTQCNFFKPGNKLTSPLYWKSIDASGVTLVPETFMRAFTWTWKGLVTQARISFIHSGKKYTSVEYRLSNDIPTKLTGNFAWYSFLVRSWRWQYISTVTIPKINLFFSFECYIALNVCLLVWRKETGDD